MYGVYQADREAKVYAVHVSSRARLDRDAVLYAAVALADRLGLPATSMRRLAETLDVTPMALYKHVPDRERLIDGMVDRVVGEIRAGDGDGTDWRTRVRTRILSSRAAVLRHPWAREAIESRTSSSPIVLAHMDALMGDLRSGGFSLDLVHDAMHALSTRMWGFARDVFPTPQLPVDPTERDAMLAEYAARYPNIVAMVGSVALRGGCDGDAEFSFALDLLLDGFERTRLVAEAVDGRLARASVTGPRRQEERDGIVLLPASDDAGRAGLDEVIPLRDGDG